MAIAFTQLAASPSTSNASVYATSSIAPTANRLLLCTVMASRGSSTDPPTPTVTGNGLTWNLVDTTEGDNLFVASGTLRNRICLFYALTGGSPSSGAVTASFSATCTGCSIIVAESNADVDLATPIVQSKKGSGAGATTATVTLAAFGDANNATYMTTAINGAAAITHEGTEIADITYATPSTQTQAQYLATADTTPACTWTGANTFGSIAVEVKLAGGTAHSLAGVVAGDSSSTGALLRGVRMAGVANGAATVTAAVGLGFDLAGAANGTSSVAGDLRRGVFLAGVSNGVAVVDGALTVTAGGSSHSLAGVVNGVAVVTGDIGLGFSLQGVVAGSSSVTGALIQGHRLVGESTGTSVVTGYMTNEWLLAGSITGTSSVTGNLFQLISGAAGSTNQNFAPIYFLLRRKRR